MMVHNLLNRTNRLLGQCLVLKQERQFFEGTPKRLREHEIHKRDLKGQEAAVRDEVLPADVLETDGVDERVEETGKAAEELEPGNAAGALCVGPKLDEEGCGGLLAKEHLKSRGR